MVHRNLSVALVGSYPPPYGGVKAHIARVHARLRNVGIHSVVYCAYSKGLKDEPGLRMVKTPRWARWRLSYWGYHWLPAYGLKLRRCVVHCHQQWNMAAPMLLLALRGSQIVMTIHDQMLTQRWKQLAPWDRLAARRLLRHEGVAWIGVSDVVCSQLVGLGVPPSRITKLPAYIPLDAETVAKEKLPAALSAFVDCHDPVITTYAWMLVRDENGDDLHSLDHCVNLVRDLRTDCPNMGLVILLANASQRDLLEQLRDHIRMRGVENQVLICDQPLRDASRLWLASDLYLRATTTDGDALSVR